MPMFRGRRWDRRKQHSGKELARSARSRGWKVETGFTDQMCFCDRGERQDVARTVDINRSRELSLNVIGSRPVAWPARHRWVIGRQKSRAARRRSRLTAGRSRGEIIRDERFAGAQKRKDIDAVAEAGSSVRFSRSISIVAN